MIFCHLVHLPGPGNRISSWFGSIRDARRGRLVAVLGFRSDSGDWNLARIAYKRSLVPGTTHTSSEGL